MILIFGGSHQGKLSYTLERFQLSEADVHFCQVADTSLPQNKPVIYQLEHWILALLQADLDLETNLAQFIESNRQSIIICTDISSGVVPIDPILRKWREEVGRLMGLLATSSVEVVRLFCGIPQRLK